MSLMTQAGLIDRYGFRLTMEQLAEVLGCSKSFIMHQVSDGTFEIPTYIEGNKRFAAYQAVAEYLDRMNEKARDEARAEVERLAAMPLRRS
jgi:hypothetical protein